MVVLNLVRAIFILIAMALYNLFHNDLLTLQEGTIVFAISFITLTVWEIVENYIVSFSNREDPLERRR